MRVSATPTLSGLERQAGRHSIAPVSMKRFLAVTVALAVGSLQSPFSDARTAAEPGATEGPEVTEAPEAADSADSSDAAAESAGVSEVTVSARRRQERAQDVPIPIAALSGDSLDGTGRFRSRGTSIAKTTTYRASSA